jgi:hypothetical protein
MGHTGDAAALGRGHIEIGFSGAAGDPLSHHGEEAWTPAGAVMRSFLVTLLHSFHHHHPSAQAARTRRAARALLLRRRSPVPLRPRLARG